MDRDGVVLLLEAILADFVRLEGASCRSRHQPFGKSARSPTTQAMISGESAGATGSVIILNIRCRLHQLVFHSMWIPVGSK